MEINQTEKPSFYTKISCPLGGTITNFNHGLNSLNVKTTVYLVNKITELGYAVGTKVKPLMGGNYPSDFVKVVDANNVSIVSGTTWSGYMIPNYTAKTSGSWGLQANWDIEIYIEVI